MKISTAQEAINGNSNDTVITPLRLKQVLNSKNIQGGGSSGGITVETDPIFKASPAFNITRNDIEKWNNPTIPDEVQFGGAVGKPDADIWIKILRNLFNPELVNNISASLTSSGIQRNDFTYWGVSDYIEVEPNTDYTLSGITYGSDTRYHCWYDANKNFIKSFVRYIPSTDKTQETVQSPSNAKYIRFSLFLGQENNSAKDERTTFQFEKGSTASPYIPYSDGTNEVLVKDAEGTFRDFYELFPPKCENEGGSDYELPIASADTLGGVKIGDNLYIDANGVLSAIGGSGGSSEPLIDIFKLPSNQVVNTATFTTIIYDTAIGNCFNTSGDGNITCTKDGIYLVLLNTIFNTNASGGRYQDIRYNNSSYALSTLVGISGLRSCLASFAILNLKEGDVLFARAYQTTGGDLSLVSGSSGGSINFIKLEGSSATITEETDPTVPDYVKQITQADIDKWNSGTGDFDGEAVTNEFIQAGVTENISLTISNAWQLREVPFNTETVKIGTGLTLTENGHIKIGSGINKVRIEGNLLVASTAVGTLDARFYRIRNGTYTNLSSYYVHLDKTADYRTCLLSIPVLDVQENDELCIRVTSDTACTFTIVNNAHLYVEKINENNIIVGGSSYEAKEYDLTQYINKNLTGVRVIRTRCINKFDRVVIDFVLSGIAITKNTAFTLLTLPDELTPPISVEYVGIANEGNAQYNCLGYINANNGNVVVNLPNDLTTAGYIRGCIVYDL